jgi:type IV secretory pathway VirB2 component (pilin)
MLNIVQSPYFGAAISIGLETPSIIGMIQEGNNIGALGRTVKTGVKWQVVSSAASMCAASSMPYATAIATIFPPVTGPIAAALPFISGTACGIGSSFAVDNAYNSAGTYMQSTNPPKQTWNRNSCVNSDIDNMNGDCQM